MKIRILFPAALSAVLLLAALSTGSPLLLLPAVLILLTIPAGFLSVLLVQRSLTVSLSLDSDKVQRGDQVTLRILLRHRGLIPVAPLALELSGIPGNEDREIHLRDVPGKQQSLALPFSAAHVGAYRVGVRLCAVEDLLGYFRLVKNTGEEMRELLVLPSVFDTEPLHLSPGDPGSDIIARATEDLSAPSDIRSYQTGDPMKKIHWKLSLRKGELLVRKFDEPILQDVLLLMDCSAPPSFGHPEAQPRIRDALLETAASLFHDQVQTDLSVHLPLLGAHPIELEKSMGLPLILENLARQDFSETDKFEQVLVMESRRLRKVGCLVVISARINSNMVDVMTRMRRLGPTLRFYLITLAPEDERLLPLIARLRQTDIEVSYVVPGKE